METEAELLMRLGRLCELRHEASRSKERAGLEAEMETRYGVSRRLVVYGTLAPGASNAHQLAGLAGVWKPALVYGARYPEGWGAVTGYPAFRWDEAGDAVPVQVFESDDLPQHWPRLDRFEGRRYCRILVPVYLDGEATVGNVYEARG